MKHILFGGGLLLLAACAEKQNEGLNPGRWEIVQETRVTKAPEGWRAGGSQSRSAFICIDARQAGAPPAELLLGMQPDSCRGALDRTGRKIEGELMCDDGTAEGQKLVVEGEIEFDRFEVRDRQATTVATGLSVGSGGTSAITANAQTETRTKARRVGDCQGDEDSLPI